MRCATQVSMQLREMHALSPSLTGCDSDFIRDAFTHLRIHQRAMIFAGNDFDDGIGAEARAALAPADSWAVPVRAERKQVGCVRFSWLPFNSILPRRHRCQPDSNAAARHIAPRFTSLRYGTPAYGQLATSTAAETKYEGAPLAVASLP